ncbi:hypothetical protein G6F50_015008 [Rhizopus delemar]|uniref:Uncharacterized protein n=1 Tax=Rhizopus delemar TaxID=936053 RepID=A0A9P6Y1L6_9FUNG|nr:hypothetical protein G6F50_015008 [Rhizopus delemar]
MAQGSTGVTKITFRPPFRHASERGGNPAALVDGPFRIQIGGHVGAANQLCADAGGLQFGLQCAVRLLPGADHHMVDRQQLLAAFDADAQALVVHAEVLDATQHAYALGFQRGAVDPAGGLAQPRPRFAGAPLQQPQPARRGLGLRPGQRAAGLEGGIHAPLGHPALRVQRRRFTGVAEELADIEADAAGADDR